MPKLPALVAATATYTGTGVFTDTQTVVIGGKTYTSQTTLTNVDGNFYKGATQAEGHANLAAAVNLGAGAGTAYAAAMTANTQVEASPAADATHTYFTARLKGALGNQIATTETQTNGSFGGTTMSGGSGSLYGAITDLQAYGQVNSDIEQALENLLS